MGKTLNNKYLLEDSYFVHVCRRVCFRHHVERQIGSRPSMMTLAKNVALQLIASQETAGCLLQMVTRNGVSKWSEKATTVRTSWAGNASDRCISARSACHLGLSLDADRFSACSDSPTLFPSVTFLRRDPRKESSPRGSAWTSVSFLGAAK